MQIAKHKVVSIDYTLTDDAGKVIDRSAEAKPLVYIQGLGSIVPGLEAALEGKVPGDRLGVKIAAADGYGERLESLVVKVPGKRFEGGVQPQVGTQYRTRLESGEQVVTVLAVDADTVTVDGNHPLAGVNLNFDVRVVDVRDASPAEIRTGQVHSAG